MNTVGEPRVTGKGTSNLRVSRGVQKTSKIFDVTYRVKLVGHGR